MIDEAGWIGVATEVWTGFGGALLGAVVGGWIASVSAAKERMLNRVTRLVELYGEHGHRLVEVDAVFSEIYASTEEHAASQVECRQPRLPTPLSLLPKVERQLQQYMATFRLIAAHETDPTRTGSLQAIGQHIVGEFGFLRDRQYEKARREQLTRCQYATHLRNSVLELMHHLPPIPRLGCWGKRRWQKAVEQRGKEVQRLDAFTARVVEQRIEEERTASAAQKLPRS